METLLDLIYFLIILIDIGAGARIIYCLIRIMTDPDEAKSYFKKIINILLFLVMANTALATMVFIESYYK